MTVRRHPQHGPRCAHRGQRARRAEPPRRTVRLRSRGRRAAVPPVAARPRGHGRTGHRRHRTVVALDHRDTAGLRARREGRLARGHRRHPGPTRLERAVPRRPASAGHRQDAGRHVRDPPRLRSARRPGDGAALPQVRPRRRLDLQPRPPRDLQRVPDLARGLVRLRRVRRAPVVVRQPVPTTSPSWTTTCRAARSARAPTACVARRAGGHEGRRRDLPARDQRARSTAGCIAIPQRQMRDVLRWLDPDRKPVIVVGPESVITRM